jgi:hypothetical protein
LRGLAIGPESPNEALERIAFFYAGNLRAPWRNNTCARRRGAGAAGVEAGVIAYLDVANAWHLYDGTPSNTPLLNPNFAGNTFTTDGGASSPAPNNMYQSFQLVNAINAKQLLKGGTKFFTHYEADGEGAGAQAVVGVAQRQRRRHLQAGKGFGKVGGRILG